MKRAVLLLLGAAVAACSAREAPPLPPPTARFAGYTKTCGDIPRAQGGIPGEIPRAYLDAIVREAKGYDPTAIVDGLCTWYFWQGGDPATFRGKPDTGGDPHFWRALEQKTADIRDATHQPVVMTLLRYLDSRARNERFRTLGVINDPGCDAATAPDAYGLWLDRCRDPYASGVIGLRLSPNPKFDPRRWNAREYFDDPRRYEPPYLAGLTCGACHIAFNPIAPPADPEHPKWENLAGTIGNQYLLEGKLYQASLTPRDFLWHVYARQQPGTSDTSRLSVDWIDNPNAMNSIYFLTSARPKHVETMNDGTTRAVPHVLKDGADSIGPAGAALRVYVNIGMCGAMRMQAEDVLLGMSREQKPFSIATAQERCQDYRQTAVRMPNAATFLDSQHGFRLASVANGRYVSYDAKQLELGRHAFATNCARCHSSKVPDGLDEVTKHDRANAGKWIALVDRLDFLDDNFLSDDDRYPVVHPDWRFAIGTNLKRTLGTNAAEGHIWSDFSSRTYKQQPSPGSVSLYNPFDPAHPIDFAIPPGKGYYRVPSLIAVWATAPLLHNNSLGAPTNDPSIEGRLRAFDDAMNRMFHPALRDGVRSIKRTTEKTALPLGDVTLQLPAGTPVDLLANVNLRKLAGRERALLLHGLRDALEHPVQSLEIERALRTGESNAALRALASQLLSVNEAPDFIEDHGHEFGSRLSAEEQRALVEYLKTF